MYECLDIHVKSTCFSQLHHTLTVRSCLVKGYGSLGIREVGLRLCWSSTLLLSRGIQYCGYEGGWTTFVLDQYSCLVEGHSIVCMREVGLRLYWSINHGQGILIMCTGLRGPPTRDIYTLLMCLGYCVALSCQRPLFTRSNY